MIFSQLAVNLKKKVIQKNKTTIKFGRNFYLSIIFSVRGVLGSTFTLTCNFGILLSFIFGSFFDFYTTPKFVILLTIVCGILLFFLPESPLFLVKQNKLSVSYMSNLHLLDVWISHSFLISFFYIQRKPKNRFDSIRI